VKVSHGNLLRSSRLLFFCHVRHMHSGLRLQHGINARQGTRRIRQFAAAIARVAQ
jgi:hypothetical protein